MCPPAKLWPDVPLASVPCLSVQYLAGAQESDGESSSGTDEANTACGDIQLLEVCQHYVQSFFVKLVLRCLGKLSSTDSSDSSLLPDLQSVVRLAVSSGGRLVASRDEQTGGDDQQALDRAFGAACRLLVQLSSCQMLRSCKSMLAFSMLLEIKKLWLLFDSHAREPSTDSTCLLVVSSILMA